MCDFIVSKLNTECLVHLDNVNNVPRLFRRTNKEVFFCYYILKVLNTLVGETFANFANFTSFREILSGENFESTHLKLSLIHI